MKKSNQQKEILTARNTTKIVLVLFSILFCADNLSAQKVLIFSDHQPVDVMRTQFLKDVFFPAIEKESKGRLKIDAHWNGELAISYNALSAVSAGKVADMATVVPEYTAEKLPLHQIFKSFPVGPSGKNQVTFFRRVYAEVPEFSAELQQNNLVEVFLSTGYGVGFFSRQPFKLLNDLKGTKWRTASFWHRDFLTNFGASPVTIPWGDEVYKALENKTLDGIMVNLDSGYDLKVYEQAPYLLTSKQLWLGHLYLVAMNKDTWNSLNTEDQQAIQRAAEIAYKSLGKVMDKCFQVQMQNLKKVGVNYRILTNKELDDFKKCTKFQDIQEVWVHEQAAKGIQESAEVLKKIKIILDESMK